MIEAAGDRKGRARPTIRDVAALAGVGIKTVSRVINHEPNVSAQMQDRVQKAVAALDFKPNLGAGALRRGAGKTLMLGLLLDAVDNPFSAALNRAVEEVAANRYTAVFAASFDDDPDRERILIDAFTRRRVDGLILTTISSDHGYLQSEREQGTPLVFVDRPPVGLLADAVVSDNEASSVAATIHLTERGHRRVAHLGDDPRISTARERSRGFQAAMAAAGLSGQAIERPDLQTEDQAAAAVVELLRSDQPPSALFASQNIILMGAVKALHRYGWQDDVALIGFDDLPLADVVRPGLTVMAQDPGAIGRLAAERVFARLDGDTSPVRTEVVVTTLIQRGSGEIRPH